VIPKSNYPTKEGLGHEKDFYGLGVIDFGIFTLCLGSEAIAQTLTLKGPASLPTTTPSTRICSNSRRCSEVLWQPVNFVLHRNRELGLEKDYFSYMTRLSVDYAVVALPTWPLLEDGYLMDMPFLFRDVDHGIRF